MGQTVESIMDPGSALIGGVFGRDSDVYKTYNVAADPLDLWGSRAAQTQEEMSTIAGKSAAQTVASQEEMRQIIEEMMAPYRQQGEAALGDFTAMSTTGQALTPMSPEYELQRQQGLQNINRGMGAQGRRLSTARDRQAGSFLNALGQEEASRIYGRTLDPIKMGAGATGAVGAAGAAAGQNIGGMYGNIGNAMNTSMQQYGQQRQQSMQQAGNALSGLGSYLAYSGG